MVAQEIAILTVDNTNNGHCERMPFSFSRLGENPVRIVISDDTPLGSGDSIRSSVWMAAVVAAMQSNDVLNGVKIQIDFSGNIDGPSAGGMICLAILSALENKTVPEDFAMTGTIMPDGTIGMVGGIVYKLRAAAKFGIKRVCIPNFLRFEQLDNGERVDLWEEGKRLNLNIAPVGNISEAYAFLHNLPYNNLSQEFSVRDVYTQEGFIEELLLKQCHKLENDAVQIMQNTGQEFIQFFRGNNFYFDELLSEVDIQMQRGWLLSASETWTVLVAILKAIAKTKEFFVGTGKKYISLLEEVPFFTSSYRNKLKEFSFFIESESEKILEEELNPQPYSRANKNIGDSYAQHDSYFFNIEICVDLLSSCVSAEDIDQADKEQLSLFARLLICKLFILSLYWVTKENTQFFISLNSIFTQINSNKNVKNVENLFFTAAKAVNATIFSDIIASLAEEAKITTDDLVQILGEKDSALLYHRIKFAIANKVHELRTDSCSDQYHITCSMFAQKDLFISACSLYVKYCPDLMISFEADDSINYKNTEFLSYLINSARVQAINSIIYCKQADIPCQEAIRLFCSAELDRDKSNSDKVNDVLCNYWGANFTAKALYLSFCK